MPASNKPPVIRAMGDSAILLEWGHDIDRTINDQVLAATRQLDSDSFTGIVDLTPSYASLVIAFDPTVTDAESVSGWAVNTLSEHFDTDPPVSRHWKCPMCYDQTLALDWQQLEQELELSWQDITTAARSAIAYLRLVLLVFPTGDPAELMCQRRHTARPRSQVIGRTRGSPDRDLSR